MFKYHKPLAVLALCATGLAGAAHADAEMDAYIAEAAPFMHHSCAGVLEAYEGDDDKVAAIVRLMAIVSMYNRQIDVVAMVAEPELGSIKGEFVEELEEACDNDGARLLAGAVDDAIRDTFAEYR